MQNSQDLDVRKALMYLSEKIKCVIRINVKQYFSIILYNYMEFHKIYHAKGYSQSFTVELGHHSKSIGTSFSILKNVL